MSGWTEQNWDHERDERKHDFPLRLEPAPSPLSTALDIALCVRALKNLQQGAELIQQYAELIANQRLDEAAGRAVNRAALALESPLSREPV